MIKIPKLKKHEKVEIDWMDIYDPDLGPWSTDEEIQDYYKANKDKFMTVDDISDNEVLLE